MELFSKRNGERWLRRAILRNSDGEQYKFIRESLRNRLREDLRYVVSKDQYLEKFLMVNNQRRDQNYLHAQTVKDLTLRELGYDISEIIDLSDLSFKTDIHDAKFFDLIELLLVFVKEEHRVDLVARLNKIFQEEGSDFAIHGFMIVSKENDGLRSIAPLIKEKILKDKIRDYYQSRLSPAQNYELLSKISAEIVQLIFSSPVAKKKTKGYTEDLCKKVASGWTEKNKVPELALLFSETVKNAKALSNQIANIRHTDRSTIPVDSPNLYKLISMKNINLAELVILSLPELFIMEQNPESLKTAYMERYQMNKDSGWIVRKQDQGNVTDIDPEDIPF